MEIPFVGGAYESDSPNVNAQRCVNLYPEIDKQAAKNQVTLYGTPGLLEFASMAPEAPAGGWVSILDDTNWVKSFEVATTWEGTYWDSNNDTVGLIPIGTWAIGFRPTKMRITWTGVSFAQNLILMNTSHNTMASIDETISGQEWEFTIDSDIGWLYTNYGGELNPIEIYNIEFFEA